jgi:hypothetical protein
MPRYDLHQHLWPEPLVAALARRRDAPRMRCDAAGRWRVEPRGEPGSPVDLRDHDPDRRARLAARDGIDVAAVCLSSPLGIEALPVDEAAPLLAAFNAGILELGEPFALWGAIGLDRPSPGAVDALVDHGAIGISLPAGAIGSAHGLARLRPVLTHLAEREAPLLVHPGPAPWAPAHAEAAEPEWWPALTRYVADMSRAWHAFAAWGRAAHPDLRVLWTMLAGGAPLQGERLVTRGGPPHALHDPRSFYDVSSSGLRTLDTAIRTLGVDRIVHGSDRPVAPPVDPVDLGPAVEHALVEHNPSELLGRVAVAA